MNARKGYIERVAAARAKAWRQRPVVPIRVKTGGVPLNIEGLIYAAQELAAVASWVASR